MSSYNPKPYTPSGPLAPPYPRIYDNLYDENKSKNILNRDGTDLDRENYLYPGRYGPKSTENKGYKYTFYKDPAEYTYHSRDSIAIDSVRSREKSFQYKESEPYYKGQTSLNRSPSFRRNEAKSKQFLDSIDNIIESHRSRYSRNSQKFPQQNNNFQAQSQQILFLKQKLIQTHQKLLKQLQQTNRLSFQLQNTQAELQAQQKQNKGYQLQIQKLRKQTQKLHQIIESSSEKKQEKFRSLQNKIQEESRRNIQLKDDLQTMRTKMLQTLMQKNNFQEENVGCRNQINILGKSVQKFRVQIKEKDQNIQYLEKQLDLIRKKYDKLQKQCQYRAQQIHQYSHLATDRQKTLNTLQNQLKNQKDRNSNSLNQFMNLQAQHKNLLRKVNQLQDLCQKYKGQIYWFEKNKQNQQKLIHQKMEKMAEQYNQLNVKYRQKQRQIQGLRKKPIYQAEKKKKNYENTRQFVNKLQSQQNQISYSRAAAARNQSKGSARGSSGSKTPTNTQKSLRTPKTPLRTQNPLSHQPVTHLPNRHASPHLYTQQKSKYISILDQVGQLESDLLFYNTEKKKMLTEMDKIDDTKVKTKEMITRRRKLEEDVKGQDDRIRRVKDQLKRIKAL